MANLVALLGAVGAVISIVVGVVKVREVWQDSRTRIEVTFNFRGDPDQGNDVIIRNLASKPLVIVYWELIWRHKRRLRWVESRDKRISADEHFTDMKLEGYGTRVLTFSEADHFDWSAQALGPDDIYIRLHFAGKKKPIARKVFPAS